MSSISSDYQALQTLLNQCMTFSEGIPKDASGQYDPTRINSKQELELKNFVVKLKAVEAKWKTSASYTKPFEALLNARAQPNSLDVPTLFALCDCAGTDEKTLTEYIRQLDALNPTIYPEAAEKKKRLEALLPKKGMLSSVTSRIGGLMNMFSSPTPIPAPTPVAPLPPPRSKVDLSFSRNYLNHLNPQVKLRTESDIAEGIRTIERLEMLGDSEEVKGAIITVQAEIRNTITQKFNDPYVTPGVPTGIENHGNTCYAASWFQLVANNQLISGAYHMLLDPDHYALAILNQYGQSDIDIELAHQAFGEDARQQDARELYKAIETDMFVIPKNGIVAGQEYGHFYSLLDGNGNWNPYLQNVKGNKDNFANSPRLPLHIAGNTTLRDALFSNLNGVTHEKQPPIKGSTRLAAHRSAYLYNRNPNLFMFQIDGAPNSTIDLPLFFDMPSWLQAQGLKPAKYTLQGFLCHVGGASLEGTESSGGHYISFTQKNGRFYKNNDAIITEITAAEYLREARTSSECIYSRLDLR